MCLISAKSTSSGGVDDLPAVDRLGVLATRLVADLAEGHLGDLCIVPVFLSVSQCSSVFLCSSVSSV